MIQINDKFIQSLQKANKILQTADHMTYVTYPLIKDKRLLFKILEQLNESTINIINAILEYEYLYKRIQLSGDKKINLEIFKQRCAERYGISPEQAEKIEQLLKLYQKHKESPFEFAKKEKIIIMSDNLHTETITIEKLKDHLINTKEILSKANSIISKRIHQTN